MRTVLLRRSILAISGLALGLAACNAITGLDANYTEVDCLGVSCADATSGDGSDSGALDGTMTDGHMGPDGAMMPDGSMPPDSSTGDGGDSGPLCDPSVVWPPMFAAPIVPPYQMVGLNMRGMDDAGITAAEVMAAACEVVDGGDSHPNLHTVSWGDAGQASFSYDKTSGRYYSIAMNAGYTGALDFTVPDGGVDGGAAAYHIAIGQPITVNGQPYEIDWSGTAPDGGRTLTQELTQLENAMTSVYAPGTPASSNCVADGTCLASNNMGTGFFGVRQPLFFYMVFNNDIIDPGVPSFFYAINPFPAAYNDFTQAQYWTAFDTTQITGGNVKGAAGVEFDVSGALYIVPQGATTPVARYDTTSDAFTNPASWQAFDVTTLVPKPQGFSGGTFDRYDAMVYLAGATGISVQYDTSTSFTLPGAWSSFDTKTLTPATTGFAGAAEILSPNTANGVADVFVPSQDGVAAMYNGGTAFGTAANWVTFNLAGVNARLTKFHGAVAGTGTTTNPKYLYLVPNADTLFTRWNPNLAFNDPTAWEIFDVATLGTAVSYSTGVYDGRYVYFSPGTGGGSILRYDTTLPFGTASSWQVGLVGMTKVNATSWDGRYIYFSGSSATITRYDTTRSFTADPTAWTSVTTTTFNANAVGFVGNTGDGRYLYFVPDTFSTVMRLDDKFPPFGPPRWESLSTY